MLAAILIKVKGIGVVKPDMMKQLRTLKVQNSYLVKREIRMLITGMYIN